MLVVLHITMPYVVGALSWPVISSRAFFCVPLSCIASGLQAQGHRKLCHVTCASYCHTCCISAILMHCAARSPLDDVNATQASQGGECSVVPALVKALQPLLSQKREGVQMHSPGHRVLSAALKATCVLLLPPQFDHGSGVALV